MIHRHFCTYFDLNYLPRALVLHASLAETMSDFTLWALCLDDESHAAVERLALPGLTPVRLGDLERHDPELAAVKPKRGRIEYYFTLTPALPLFLLETRPEIDLISYLDADLRFYASPEHVFDELGEGSILIVPHGFPDELRGFEVYGKYNVGMVVFRDSPDGRACLARWRAQCIDWCHDRLDDGRFADQAYLNDWPDTMKGVVVADRPGIGLGPWNFMRFAIDASTTPPTVNGHPLVFYHFHAFRSVSSHIYDDGLLPYGRMSMDVRDVLYGGYVRALRSARDVARTPLEHSAHTGRGWIRPGWRKLLGLAVRRRLLYDVGGRVLG